MDPIYIAANLTPVLSALIIQGITTWFVNPQDAPPGLFKMGALGHLYKSAIVLTGFTSQFSLLGLAISGEPSFLAVIGVYIAGIISGGAMIAMCKSFFAFNLLFENLVMPGILAVNLFVVHWLAWNSV